MSERTTHSIAHFAAPFVLGGLEGQLPAGDYDIDHDEELIEGMDRKDDLRDSERGERFSHERVGNHDCPFAVSRVM